MTDITDLLLQGPRSAPELSQRLAISQATFSRLVAREEQILRFGKARATRYALIRPIRGLCSIPIWRVDERGQANKFADLFPCWPQGSCLVVTPSGNECWYDGIPWYLTDLRPQGFLGRAWGRKVAMQLNLPEDIRLWQEDDILFALTVFHGECAGGWLVGEENYQRWINAQTTPVIYHREKLTEYVRLARNALSGEIVGSSAGGEQPKFTCYTQTFQRDAHVLVKFTVAQQNAISQRWGDLLFAESVALQLLRDAGIPACEASTMAAPDGQVFLEAIRFDCIGESGRSAIVSLEAVQSEFVSSPGTWPGVMRQLLEKKLISPETLRRTESIWAFGRLIANSDMHGGNLSFYWSEPPFILTPVYDMLPMAYAPNSAGMMRETAADLTFDITVSRETWLFAIPLAQAFWETVYQDERISADFRQIAAQMPAKIAQLAEKIGRMGE